MHQIGMVLACLALFVACGQKPGDPPAQRDLLLTEQNGREWIGYVSKDILGTSSYIRPHIGADGAQVGCRKMGGMK